ncbi:MAG: hypothetical protein WBY94_09735, partial [Polyangiaceae bacterium]
REGARMRIRNPYLTAIMALAGCHCTTPPPAPVAPTYVPDASYQVGDGASESDCARACDHLTAVCGPQGAACAIVYTLIELRQEVRLPDGGALTCKDVLAAPDKSSIEALHIGCP